MDKEFIGGFELGSRKRAERARNLDFNDPSDPPISRTPPKNRGVNKNEGKLYHNYIPPRHDYEVKKQVQFQPPII